MAGSLRRGFGLVENMVVIGMMAAGISVAEPLARAMIRGTQGLRRAGRPPSPAGTGAGNRSCREDEL